MKVKSVVAAVVALGAMWAGAAETKQEANGIFCDLRGLSGTERQEQRQLRLKLEAAVLEEKELPDGFSVRLADERLSGVELMRWVGLERRCCPFLRFGVALEPKGGPTWLSLTGGPGVKEFLRVELGH